MPEFGLQNRAEVVFVDAGTGATPAATNAASKAASSVGPRPNAPATGMIIRSPDPGKARPIPRWSPGRTCRRRDRVPVPL